MATFRVSSRRRRLKPRRSSGDILRCCAVDDRTRFRSGQGRGFFEQRRGERLAAHSFGLRRATGSAPWRRNRCGLLHVLFPASGVIWTATPTMAISMAPRMACFNKRLRYPPRDRGRRFRSGDLSRREPTFPVPENDANGLVLLTLREGGPRGGFLHEQRRQFRPTVRRADDPPMVAVLCIAARRLMRRFQNTGSSSRQNRLV